MSFNIESKYKPSGDQPKAIKKLIQGLKKGYNHQTLLGVTGSGKTFSIANVIKTIKRPTLVIAHNKTLAAQLCNEFRTLFPQASVHYFVSYYDYYQPESYLPNSDTYIGKEAMINEEIDKLRHAATASLLTQRQVIIVASVSCIYGLGSPKNYQEKIIHIKKGDKITRNDLIKKLIEIQFTRTNSDLKRGYFRVQGNNWEIMPPAEEIIYNFELSHDDIVQDIYKINPVKGFIPGKTPKVNDFVVSPARHFITKKPKRKKAVKKIEQELKQRIKYFEERGELLEAERIERRTKSDIAMIKEVGYCNGIENYSRHLSNRKKGEPSPTLIDYFPSDFLTVVDESHVTIPQIRGMFAGDRSRKKTLVKHGFRLPSALDNRPLKFNEFEKKINQVIYTSATPGDHEKRKSSQIVEQIIRPTGLIDPKLLIKPAKGQINDLIKRIEKKVEKKERVLVTTLTKKMAEDLSGYLQDKNFKVKYLHSDIETLDRIKTLTKLRRGDIDIIVGVNLLREGLDLPEVTLIGILDADKEGFLRSFTSLIQVIGRAARNVKGKVILYADKKTKSLKQAIKETERRREKQIDYNKKHNITPKTIIKDISDIIPIEIDEVLNIESKPLPENKEQIKKSINKKEKEMRIAAKELNFELAAILRDEIKELSKKLKNKKNEKEN